MYQLVQHVLFYKFILLVSPCQSHELLKCYISLAELFLYEDCEITSSLKATEAFQHLLRMLVFGYDKGSNIELIFGLRDYL